MSVHSTFLLVLVVPYVLWFDTTIFAFVPPGWYQVLPHYKRFALLCTCPALIWEPKTLQFILVTVFFFASREYPTCLDDTVENLYLPFLSSRMTLALPCIRNQIQMYFALSDSKKSEIRCIGHFSKTNHCFSNVLRSDLSEFESEFVKSTIFREPPIPMKCSTSVFASNRHTCITAVLAYTIALWTELLFRYVTRAQCWQLSLNPSTYERYPYIQRKQP